MAVQQDEMPLSARLVFEQMPVEVEPVSSAQMLVLAQGLGVFVGLVPPEQGG